MRRDFISVPSVDPEELETLCERLHIHRGDGPLNHTSNVALCVRYLEARQYGLDHARLLPEFVQKIVFRIAATMPLDSELSMIVENANTRSMSLENLRNPTRAVIL